MAGQNDITLHSGHATPENIVLRDLPAAPAVAGTTIYLYAGHATPENVIMGDPTVIREEAGGGTTHQVEASITGTATVLAVAAVVRAAAASITGTAAVSASAVAARAASASIRGTATVSASAVAIRTASASITGTATVSATASAARGVEASIVGTATVTADAELTVSESDDDGVGPIDSGGARRKKPRDDKPRAPRVFDTYTAPVLSSSSADNIKPGRVRSDGRRNAVALALLMLDEDPYGF